VEDPEPEAEPEAEVVAEAEVVEAEVVEAEADPQPVPAPQGGAMVEDPEPEAEPEAEVVEAEADPQPVPAPQGGAMVEDPEPEAEPEAEVVAEAVAEAAEPDARPKVAKWTNGVLLSESTVAKLLEFISTLPEKQQEAATELLFNGRNHCKKVLRKFMKLLDSTKEASARLKSLKQEVAALKEAAAAKAKKARKPKSARLWDTLDVNALINALKVWIRGGEGEKPAYDRKAVVSEEHMTHIPRAAGAFTPAQIQAVHKALFALLFDSICQDDGKDGMAAGMQLLCGQREEHTVKELLKSVNAAGYEAQSEAELAELKALCTLMYRQFCEAVSRLADLVPSELGETEATRKSLLVEAVLLCLYGGSSKPKPRVVPWRFHALFALLHGVATNKTHAGIVKKAFQRLVKDGSKGTPTPRQSAAGLELRMGQIGKVTAGPAAGTAAQLAVADLEQQSAQSV